MSELERQLEQARQWAVYLEAENAELLARIAKLEARNA